MGNCIITRKSVSGSGFNYVDNNLGIICPCNITNKRLIIQNNQLSMTQNQGVTAEICCNITPPSKNSRLFEIGSLNLCLASEYINNVYLVDLAIGGTWLFPSERPIIPLNNIHTYSLTVTAESMNVYIDGEILFVTTEANSSDITTIAAGNKDLFLMGGSDSDKTSPGDLYAFRFYNRVLSANEMV